jgi:3-hydroxyisobutyrate dehydrogenase
VVIGGEKDALEKCLGILRDLCQKIVCVPEPWMPKAMKIAVIMFAATNSIICAEVSTSLTAQGIDPKLFLSLLQTTGSRESAGRMEEFLKRGKSYGGALSNSYKDIRQALETAAALDMPLPLMSTVNQLQEMARAQGLTRLNTPAAIGKLYEVITGIDLNGATVESERVFPEPKAPEVIYLGESEN